MREHFPLRHLTSLLKKQELAVREIGEQELPDSGRVLSGPAVPHFGDGGVIHLRLRELDVQSPQIDRRAPAQFLSGRDEFLPMRPEFTLLEEQRDDEEGYGDAGGDAAGLLRAVQESAADHDRDDARQGDADSGQGGPYDGSSC